MPTITSKGDIISGVGGGYIALDGKIIEKLLPWKSGSWSQLSRDEIWGAVFDHPTLKNTVKTFIYNVVSETVSEFPRPIEDYKFGRKHYSDEQGGWCIYDSTGTSDGLGRHWPHPAVPVGKNRNGITAIKRDFQSGGETKPAIIDFYDSIKLVGSINIGEGWHPRLGEDKLTWLDRGKFYWCNLDGTGKKEINVLGTDFCKLGNEYYFVSWAPARCLVLYSLTNGPTKAIRLTPFIYDEEKQVDDLAFGWSCRTIGNGVWITGAGGNEGEPPNLVRVWTVNPLSNEIRVEFADGRLIENRHKRELFDSTKLIVNDEPIIVEPTPMSNAGILEALNELRNHVNDRLDELESNLESNLVLIKDILQKQNQSNELSLNILRLLNEGIEKINAPHYFEFTTDKILGIKATVGRGKRVEGNLPK